MKINRGKRREAVNEVKVIENINENPRFSNDKPRAKWSISSNKLQDHIYEWRNRNPFELTEDNPLRDIVKIKA